MVIGHTDARIVCFFGGVEGGRRGDTQTDKAISTLVKNGNLG
jgi:hypothetical protein